MWSSAPCLFAQGMIPPSSLSRLTHILMWVFKAPPRISWTILLPPTEDRLDTPHASSRWEAGRGWPISLKTTTDTTMPKSSLLQYTLTALSALILIPLTYSLITRQDAQVTTVDAQLSLAIHRPLTHQTSSHHSCNHCAEPLPGDRQAAQFQKIAAAGMLWEKSSPDPNGTDLSGFLVFPPMLDFFKLVSWFC